MAVTGSQFETVLRLAACPFRFGEITLTIPEIAEALLKVERDRVVDGPPDLRITESVEDVGPLVGWKANHELMPDVPPGQMSSYIFSLEPGDEVTISGPYGEPPIEAVTHADEP